MAEIIYTGSNKRGCSLGVRLFEFIKNKKQTKTIIIDGETKNEITYGEILEESVKCARAMQKLGLKKGDVVAIVSENHIRYAIPVLAGWYLGLIISPLNPMYTVREVIHAASLSRPKIIFCTETVSKILPAVKNEVNSIEHIIVFGDESKQFICYNEFLEAEDADTNNFIPEVFDITTHICAILCSSGTTGYPKGVMLSHENVQYSLEYMSDPNYANISSTEITVSLLPNFHIFGLYILINAIAHGMKLIDLTKFKPDVYLQCIQDYKATKLFVVPSLAVFLAKSPLLDNYDVSSINDIVCGAAPLGKDIEVILRNKLKLAAIRQLYGLTECSGVTTMFPTGIPTKPGSSGVLVPMAKCKVVDPETKETLGPNKPGELCFSGPLVMKGYIGDPLATKNIFDEDGFLHTGDIGYYDNSKHYYIIDRLKDLIKFKGFQVPPAELEDILLNHEAVKEAAVVGMPDERAGELPVAFIVKQPEKYVKEEELIQLVAEQLSYQKRLHGGVRFIDEIPKSGSGKILRRKLREML